MRVKHTLEAAPLTSPPPGEVPDSGTLASAPVEIETEVETGNRFKDYTECTVVELRDELHGRHLPVSGNKSKLIARLEADDES